MGSNKLGPYGRIGTTMIPVARGRQGAGQEQDFYRRSRRSARIKSQGQRGVGTRKAIDPDPDLAEDENFSIFLECKT